MKTIKELIEAKETAERKINNILATFSHGYEVNNISVDVEITRLYEEGRGKPVGVGASTKIKIVL